MRRRLQPLRALPALALAAALLAACAPAQPAATPAPTASAAPAATPAPTATPQPAPVAAPAGCPDYAQAMAAVEGCGYTQQELDSMYTDAETCLQNAYALAAALYTGDARAAAQACDFDPDTFTRAASGKESRDDVFPFADLTGLTVEGVAFSGGGAGEPLWLTISVTDPGATPLPAGVTTYAVTFGNGFYTASGCVEALVPQGGYLPQSGSAYTAVNSFRTWVTTQPWQDADDLPPVSTTYYLAGFASGRGLEPAGAAWSGEELAQQAQDAFGATPYFFQHRSAAAFTQEDYGAIYEEATDTFDFAASPGYTGCNQRMTAFIQNADGTAALTIARGANGLWMQPGQQVTYTMRPNDDGSWAILRADWTGGDKTPEYQTWETRVRLKNGQPLPAALPLVANLTGTENGSGLTWQQAAERFGVPAADLQALNPEVQPDENGLLGAGTLLVDPDYPLPDTTQRVVQIVLPWEDHQGIHRYYLPAQLDHQAAVTVAEALDFLWHYNVRLGYFPAEPLEGENGAELYQAAEGARFTRYSELKAHLEQIFTPELAAAYASGGYDEQNGYYTGYLPGENDELCFGNGARGANLLVLAQLCTAPQTQPDGSIVFGLLGLERGTQADLLDNEAAPVQAVWHTIRLAPAADGWRVAEIELAV